MDIAIIREAMHAAPFQPFRLRLADGRTVLVPHPDFIAAAPRRVAIINPQDDTFLLIEPLLIVSLDFPPGTAVAPAQSGDATNGPSG